MLQPFQEFIIEENLFKSEDVLIVAVSGGVDSMVLMHLLFLMQQPIIVAHCNYQLRGNDSHLDQQLVASYCKEHQLVFETITFDTIQLKENSGKSTQMLARELRYNWFESLRLKHNASYILTAHHKQDVAETLLINLTRGTGIKGLHGIRPINKQLRRPLLRFNKKELLLFATQNNIPWREDKSNHTNKYIRNHIRNEVIPILKNYNPAVEEHIFATTKIVNEYEQLVHALADVLSKEYTKKETQTFSISYRIRSYQNGLPILFHWLETYGFTWTQAHTLYYEPIKQTGSILLSESHRLIYNREEWIIDSKDTKQPNIQFKASLLPLSIQTLFGTLHFTKSSLIEFVNRSIHPFEIFMDASVLESTFEIAPWNAGDRMQPLGMHTSKKISDILIDKKIDLHQKSTVILLKTSTDILWIVGLQSSDLFKITAKTSDVIKITFSPK
jgi:tRNA(Ile)-lysidine synthase